MDNIINIKTAELELQIKRVQLGVDEMDFKILQLEDEKKRLESHKQISIKRIKELKELIEKENNK